MKSKQQETCTKSLDHTMGKCLKASVVHTREDVFTLSCFRRDLHDHHRALREMGTHKITAMFSVLPCDIITRNDWDDARLSKCDHARQKATDLSG